MTWAMSFGESCSCGCKYSYFYSNLIRSVIKCKAEFGRKFGDTIFNMECHIICSSHSVLIIIILIIILPISQLQTVKAIVFVNSPETQALNDSYQATVLHRERGREPLGDTLRFSSLIEAECLYFYCKI